MQNPKKYKKTFSEKKDDKNNSLKSYATYSALAFQMGIIIFIGTWGGYQLDRYFHFDSHVLTLILSMLSVCIAIYSAIKDFIKKK
jgi:F0F1-type ATP synthase assembly protein I